MELQAIQDFISGKQETERQQTPSKLEGSLKRKETVQDPDPNRTTTTSP